MKTPRGRTLLVILSSIVAAGCGLVLVGPKALGGPTSILAVSENSMEPRINAGDLILVRAGGPYHVGQIVAYHNIPASATFLHRIVAIRGTGFAMKGDHNGWIDPGTAQPGQIVGSLWIRIPGGGSAFTWVASPLHGALLAAAAAFLIGLREILRRRTRRRRQAGGREDGDAPALAPPGGDRLRNVAPGPWTWRPPPVRPDLPVDTILKATLAAALIGAAACTFLGVVSFSRPASTAGRPAPLFRQAGRLSYQATASPSPVYPTGRVTSPTPLYLHLVKGATFSFRYRVAPIGQTAVSGFAQMRLVLHGNTGWTRTLAVTPPHRFHGTAVSLRQRVSIAQVRSLLASIQSLTASPDSYSMTVEPVVVTHGSAEGQPFVRRFTPRFTFGLTDAEMTLAGAPATPAAVTSALSSTSLETGTPPRPRAAELSVGPLRLPVAWWRVLALALGTAMIGTAAATAIEMHRRLACKGEPALIAAKHRDLLVPLALSPVEGDRHVTVRSFDDLVRVARRHETTIMHHADADGSEHYLVLADGVTYRYRSSSTRTASDGPSDDRAADADAA
jgi:signal peptidase I